VVAVVADGDPAGDEPEVSGGVDDVELPPVGGVVTWVGQQSPKYDRAAHGQRPPSPP